MLTVHMGLHKTGSTSIQTVLGLERGHIRRRQVYLPWTDLFVTDGAIRTENVDRIIRLSRRGWHVVASSEGALGQMSRAYPQAAEVAEELARLFASIPLRVVVYLRPQHEWAASALGQLRVEGGDCDPDSFARGLLTARGFHHAALVADLTQALPLGALIVRPYERQMDVLEDFFTSCGLGAVPPTYAGLRANRSSGSAYSPVSPFSVAVQEDLVRHFRSDWTALANSGLPAADAVRHDLLQLVEGDVTVEASALPADEPFETTGASGPNGPAQVSRGSGVGAFVQTSARLLRHGPRLAVLRGVVAQDVRRSVGPAVRHAASEPLVAAGIPRSRS